MLASSQLCIGHFQTVSQRLLDLSQQYVSLYVIHRAR